MKTTRCKLSDLDILEEAAFDRAGLTLLEPCLELLSDLDVVCFPKGRGLGRLVNLLQWQVDQQLEYLDGDAVAADQVVHFALHHLWHRRIGSDHPFDLLFAECMASASDLYLLGKLSNGGEETDFLVDTLDSFGSYYEIYSSESRLEKLVARILENPYQTMSAAVDYLFRLGVALLSPQINLEALARFQDDLLYPLAHHYNISNWILTIRNRFPGSPDARELLPMLALIPADEAAFIALFQSQ